MKSNRIISVRVLGLRSLADVTLKLDGLTVLIGHNGSGKSSLIEVCEILRRLGGENFFDELQQIHGGVSTLIHFGQSFLQFIVRMFIDGQEFEYSIRLESAGRINQEHFGAVLPGIPEPINPVVQLLERLYDRFRIVPNGGETFGPQMSIDPRSVALASFGNFPPHPALREALRLLRGIDVHLPFDTTARWAQRARGVQPQIRGTSIIEPADALTRFGNNLANAFHHLKNDFSDAHWKETMDFVKLGLGFDVESINTRADSGGGSISLRVKYAGIDEQLPAFSLSDGTLSYLCFVALARLNAQKSLVAFDEPETHLHPELLMRVLDFFESMAEKQPILLATHSDRLLDGLANPARSVVVCELDEQRATKLRRMDEVALAEWMKDYRGLGDIRSAGHLLSVVHHDEESCRTSPSFFTRTNGGRRGSLDFTQFGDGLRRR